MVVTAGRRSRDFALLAGILVVVLAGANIPTPLYVVYESLFGFRPDLTTVIFGVYAVGVLVSLLFFGRASDHLGRRPVIGAALVLTAASAALFLAAENVLMLCLARLVSGLAIGLVVAPATAGLSELEPGRNARRAAVVATSATMIGLGLGPLLSGFLSEYAPAPTRLVYAVYLGLLTLAAVALALVPETVAARDRRIAPRLDVGLPAAIRAEFLPAAMGVFSGFFVLGLFVGLIPSFLGNDLHWTSHALGGAVVFLLFGVAATAELRARRLADRHALGGGLLVLPLALAVIVLAFAHASLPAFLVGTVLGGTAVGLVFIGGQATVNRISPTEQRAAVTSALFTAAYAGFSVPVVAVGVASVQLGTLRATTGAAIGFAVICGFALWVLAGARRHRSA
ncbi:MFS transporter [Streptomyces sp. A3M-1-3]|uniref:MFS transporter n=1 Tax=Streptomyces sp. A3M-1-3 TaxID=2962044 RepID=UPI0020B8505C|nr:MFS transporter [Streptomyces sp. A3M-1-3]MCP3820693.1 MFS transporter [Streptomyces sp. A3M-1-3]